MLFSRIVGIFCIGSAALPFISSHCCLGWQDLQNSFLLLSIPDLSSSAFFCPYDSSNNTLAAFNIASSVNAPAIIAPGPPTYLAEHGPCPVGGNAWLLTMLPSSLGFYFTATLPPCPVLGVLLCSTQASQSFVSATVWNGMKASDVATTDCRYVTTSRTMVNFGTSAPLKTTASVRLKIQFPSGDYPSATFSVWADVATALQHSVSLGRDSWMRFSIFISAFTKANATFHLRYSGASGVPLLPTPQLVGVNIIHRTGTAALAGH